MDGFEDTEIPMVYLPKYKKAAFNQIAGHKRPHSWVLPAPLIKTFSQHHFNKGE